MIVSIISTLCGLVLLFNPFKGALVFTKIVGLFIIIYALLDVISTITIKRNVKIIHNAIESVVTEAEVVEEADEPKKRKSK